MNISFTFDEPDHERIAKDLEVVIRRRQDIPVCPQFDAALAAALEARANGERVNPTVHAPIPFRTSAGVGHLRKPPPGDFAVVSVGGERVLYDANGEFHCWDKVRRVFYCPDRPDVREPASDPCEEDNPGGVNDPSAEPDVPYVPTRNPNHDPF